MVISAPYPVTRLEHLSEEKENKKLEHLSEEKENKKWIFPDVTYECVRCGTPVTGAELAKLPEPTCANCGYRVFRKVRGPTVKNVKGQ